MSCERIFQPGLEKKPVIVLSNNDGCIISRSNEAKQLGLPMGAPFFKWEQFCKKNHVAVFSSNYELYGDISRRIMRLLKQDFHSMEIYSIDEAFLYLHDENSMAEVAKIRKKIKKYIGIPISIGVGRTKTLAKIANHLAKQETKAELFILNNDNIEKILPCINVSKIWGVGRRLAEKLYQLDITTADHLYRADPKYLRAHFNVVMEKIVYELRGTACLSLENIQPRKQIISSRSFGNAVTELVSLEEAISHYAAIAAEKLRRQKSLCQALTVFMQINVFQQEISRYEASMVFPFSSPTADTRNIIRAAKKCIRDIYRKGYRYHKVGIILLDLIPASFKQHDMLMIDKEEKSNRLMKMIDKINQHQAKEVIFYCAEGIDRKWQMRCDRRSPRYTTRWDELPRVTF